MQSVCLKPKEKEINSIWNREFSVFLSSQKLGLLCLFAFCPNLKGKKRKAEQKASDTCYMSPYYQCIIIFMHNRKSTIALCPAMISMTKEHMCVTVLEVCHGQQLVVASLICIFMQRGTSEPNQITVNGFEASG